MLAPSAPPVGRRRFTQASMIHGGSGTPCAYHGGSWYPNPDGVSAGGARLEPAASRAPATGARTGHGRDHPRRHGDDRLRDGDTREPDGHEAHPEPVER